MFFTRVKNTGIPVKESSSEWAGADVDRPQRLSMWRSNGQAQAEMEIERRVQNDRFPVGRKSKISRERKPIVGGQVKRER